MLWRKKEKDISNWISSGKKALLVTGARQVGKTFLIEETLKKKKIDYVKFNLIDQPEISKLFDVASDSSAKSFINGISLVANHELVPGKTVIFFDEIQVRKDIATKIKFLVEEGSFRYILSGSLLGVELRDLRSAPVGYVETIEMYPIDLEEFFIALGIRKKIISTLRHSFDNMEPVDPFIHKKLMEAFRSYLVVGGMPEAVFEYIQSHDYNKVLKVHSSILPQYKKDFSKYETADRKLKLVKTYELIPAELNEKNKRYTFSHLDKNLKLDRYVDSFEWLIHAGVSIPVYNTTEPKIPLMANEKSNLFKLFMSDVGLLSAAYGKPTIIKMLSGSDTINFGAVYENVVAQELTAHEYKLYYFNSKKQGEVDFVIEHQNACLPLEVKSGKDYKKHNALSNILSNANYGIEKAIVLCNDNVSAKGKVVYMPIYMMMFIDQNRESIPQFPAPDLGKL